MLLLHETDTFPCQRVPRLERFEPFIRKGVLSLVPMSPIIIRIGETFSCPFWLAQTTYSISSATDASPTVITTVGDHDFSNGDKLIVSCPAANGPFIAEGVTANTVTLTSSVASGLGLQTTGVIGKTLNAAGGSITFTTVGATWVVGQSLFTTTATGTVPIYSPTFAWSDITSGYFILSFTAAQTFAMTPGNYFIRVFFTDSTGVVSEELNYPVKVQY